MFPKNGGCAWGSKKLSGQGCAVGDWPQLGKQGGLAKGNEKETWPRLVGTNSGGSHASNQQSSNQVGFGGCNSISPISFQNPSSMLNERPESSWSSKNDECSTLAGVKSTNTKTSDGNHVSQCTPLGNGEDQPMCNKEERKLAFKKLCKERKEQQKAERRRKKEDDTLRKMLGPKGLKVTVIDEKIFSKVYDQGDSKSHPKHFPSLSEVQLDSSSFPDLRSPKDSGVKSNATRIQKIQHSLPVGVSESKVVGNVDKLAKTTDVGPPKSSKSKRRRDPVVVDIWKAIEICKGGKRLEGGLEGEGSVLRVSRAKEGTKIAGNILDASNPLRHRGKKRETPTKRHATRLKKAIMTERRRRREAKNSASKNDANADAGEVKSSYSLSEITGTVPGACDSCVPVAVAFGCERSDSAREMKEMEREDRVEECHSKPCCDAIDVDKMVKDSLHSRNFREYCNHWKSSDLSEHVTAMLKDIIKFQDRLHATQPIKAESHRRYVVGLRQTKNSLAAHKVKIIILAQDLERVPSPGGLDDAVNSIIRAANSQNVPVVFPSTRRQLGKTTYRKVGVSCIGVLNYQGTEERFKKITSALEESKREYEDRFQKEKTRILYEQGILATKSVDDVVTAVEEEVKPCNVEFAATLPLFQKLAEAVAELSLNSQSPKAVKDELSDV